MKSAMTFLLFVLSLVLVLGRAALAENEPGAEVAVYGDEGVQVILDGRPVGTLPLSVPLVVPVGRHRIRLQKASRWVEAQLDLLANQPVEVRFTLVPPMAVVTPTAAAVLLHDHAVTGPVQQQLARAVSQGAARERVLVLPQDRPGAQQAAAYVLRLRTEREARGAWRFTLALHDVAAAAEAARGEVTCAPCDAAEAARRLGDLAGRVVREAATRPRGTLAVITSPPGARVVLDGREVGAAPLRRPAFVGAHDLRVELPGHQVYQGAVQIQGEAVAEVRVTLSPDRRAPGVPAAALASSSTRGRRGLRVGKWLVAGAGLAEVIAGATFWGLDGHQTCPLADIGHCRWEFNGQPAGVALLLAGGVTLGVAGLLFYVDGRLRASRNSLRRSSPDTARTTP